MDNIIYVPGLAENLLSLEALYIAGYESRDSIKGYAFLKDGKVVAKGRRIGRSTYLDKVAHKDALYIKSEQARRTVEYTQRQQAIGRMANRQIAKMERTLTLMRRSNKNGNSSINGLGILKRDALTGPVERHPT